MHEEFAYLYFGQGKIVHFIFDPGLTVIFNRRYFHSEGAQGLDKPHGFFLGFLATFICFCVTVLFYRYLHFVVLKNEINFVKNEINFVVTLSFCFLTTGMPSRGNSIL